VKNFINNALKQFYLQDIRPGWKAVVEETQSIFRPDLWSQMNGYERLGRIVAGGWALVFYTFIGAMMIGICLALAAWMFSIIKIVFLWLIAGLGVK
jgi:hypothetical protein